MNNLLSKYSGRNSFAQHHFFNKKSGAGFTLIELFVVMVVIIILSIIGLRSYSAFTVKQRDAERLFQLYRFAKLLEQYRNDMGVYPCGSGYVSQCLKDTSWEVNSVYEWVCTDSVPLSVQDASQPDSPYHGNDAREVGAFLNGGQCCVDKRLNNDSANPLPYPSPTTTPTATQCPDSVRCNGSIDSIKSCPCDDSAWGLYRWGYLDTPNIFDPLNSVVNGKAYHYCYAVAGYGRKEYALFARMENSKFNRSDDGGVSNNWYELYSSGYSKPWISNPDPNGGWAPWLRSTGAGDFDPLWQ